MTQIFVIFLLFVAISLAVPPTIVSSVYKEKTIPFSGKYSTYRIHEVEFDQDIYLATNWACDCVNQTVNNCTNKNTSTLTTTQAYTTLQYDTWSVNHSLAFGDGDLFAFTVDQSIYTCPNIDIIHNTHWGAVAFSIGNTLIPSSQASDFVQHFASGDRIRICNSDPRFRYGTYFVYVYLYAPTVGFYDIKFKLSQSSNCNVAEIPNYNYVGASYTATPLYDSVMEYIFFNHTKDFLYQYEMQINQRCANISITNRVPDGNILGYLTVSFSNPATNLGDQFTWPFLYNGAYDISNTFSLNERNIVIPNFCVQGPLPYSIYIGLQCSSSADATMSLVATTDNAGMDLTRLSDFGLHQTMYSVGTQAFTFMCGSDKKDDNTCPGTSYSSHFGYDNGIPSCAHVNPTLSADGMSPNFPRTGSDVDYGFYDFMFQIDFSADFVRKPNAARYPKRVSVIVYVEGWSEATNEYMRFINHPYDTCALTFFNKFMNQYYELPVGTELLLGTDLQLNRSYIPWTPYVSTVCDAATAKSLVQQRSDLLAGLRAATSTLDAQYIELQLSILHAQDAWIACENYLNTFFNQTAATVAFTQQALCTQNYNSDEFFNDACCDWGRNEILYCPSQNVDLSVSQPQGLIQNMTDQCQYPQCVAILSVPYIATQQGLLDPVVGCNAKFVLPNEASFVTFIYQCQVDTVGDDLQGSFCSTDADCLWGGSCINGLSGLRCNHTANDVLKCFANSIDPALAQYMFSANNIAQQFTPAAFIQNFQNVFISPDCYGPNSKVYQEHFHYGIKGNCIDGCTISLDCFSKTNDCEVPTCNSVGAGGVGCSRTFSPVEANQTACVEEFNCNWFDCTAAGLDAATCQAWCKNSSIPDTVCLDCTNSALGCVEIAGLSTDEAGCNTGYCSSDPTIHDPLACAALTRCTVTFPECGDPIDLPGGPYLDAASCAAVGQCSSQCRLTSQYYDYYLANGGICFESRMEVGGPVPFCNPYEADSVGDWACIALLYNDSASCTANNNGANVSYFPGKNIWKTLATTEAACVAEMACYQPVDPTYDLQLPTTLWGVYMSQSECATAGTIKRYNLPHVWKSIYSWQNGTFSQARMIPYTFVNRTYAQVRTIAPVMNFTGFRSAVLSALSSSSNIIRSSYETCLYDSLATFLGSVACDCQGNTSSNCYTATTPVLAQLFVCPFIESEAITPKATVTFYNTTVSSTSTCNVVTLYAQSINLYVAPTGDRLTSEIFYYQRRNVYSIVTNLALIQGQTISNLLEVSFPPALVIAQPFEVCIDVVEGYPIDPLFTQYDIGILRQNPIRVQALGVGVVFVINTTTSLYRVCGNVTESGSYFAILVNPNFNEVRNSMIIQCAFSSFLFLIAVVIATYYVYCFFFYYVQVRLYFKCILSVIVWFFCIIRMAYWIVVACGGFDNVQPASLVLFELPTFLFLVMFSCIVYLWADFQVKITKLKPMRGASEANRTSWWLYPFLLFQLIKIICVVILLIVYYTIPDPVDSLPCVIAVPVSGGNKSKVSLAYAVVIAFFGLLTSISGLIIAARFTKIVFDMEQRQTSAKRAAKKKIAIYTALIVGGIFAICFFVKSAVFIAFVVVQTVDFPIIVFTILEIIPTFALMFYIAPARTPISDSSMYTTYFSRTTSTRGDSRGGSTHSVKHSNVSLKMTGQGTDSSTPSTATKKADETS